MRCRSAFLISTNGFSLAALASFLLLASGCGAKSWLDQSELSRNQGGRLVVPILTSIDPIDEAETEFVGSQEVKPDDLRVFATDYVIGRNDLITVSVFDLVNGGIESVRTSRVSETGMLSLPGMPDPIKAAGLTEADLQKAMVQAYRESGILQKAQVSVQVVEARGRTFNITGAVTRAGQYVILESDFRLLNAIIQAGGETFPSEYLYVIRKVSSEKPSTRPSTQEEKKPPTTIPTVDPLAPRTEAPVRSKPILAFEEPAARPPEPAKPATAEPTSDERRFIFLDGKPVLTDSKTGQPVTRPADAADVPRIPTTQPFTDITISQPAYEFGSSLGNDEQRVIRVPYKELRNGDLRYNIVVRPNDVIIVPLPTQGFYYMGGHFQQPGVFNLTGQKITLKQAVISARMLDGYAIPNKTDVIRRIGADKEVFVRVDLARIFEGRQPDVFLKANDVVQVGTDWYPPFLAALRGAFRLTYGFGFLYDRNYAPQQKLQQ
ncbi:MAG TPA: polysaccharide biosynthesis/export family protein [Tepidisphaeraceae bacterium]|nr:polysaccharide biosynthesis/export family protein [Tepidisphaeraceae bacterium]